MKPRINRKKATRLNRAQITLNAKARRRLEELQDTRIIDDLLIGEQHALRKQTASV